MTSILVTGATTPLGERLIQRLLADERVQNILAVGLGEPEVLPPLRPKARLTWLAADLTRPRLVRQLLFGPARDLEVQVVVHLAQHRSVYSRGREVHRQNVEALRSVLDMAEGHPTIRRVVVRSFAEVYKVGIDLPVLVSEEHPLDLSADTPQYIRDRVEADLTACARMGVSEYQVVVLRCAEALEAATGSQLYDFLEAPLALRPAGYDPMVNVATSEDLVEALRLAIFSEQSGVYNIPGCDTLPLSECLNAWGTRAIALPGPLVRALYRLKHRLVGSDFSYAVNRRRLHYGLVLNGARARLKLGYVPRHPVVWPRGGAVAELIDRASAERPGSAIEAGSVPQPPTPLIRPPAEPPEPPPDRSEWPATAPQPPPAPPSPLP